MTLNDCCFALCCVSALSLFDNCRKIENVLEIKIKIHRTWNIERGIERRFGTTGEHPFLFLVKRDQLGVHEGGALLSEGEHCITTNADAGSALHVYKNPKVGGKAARVVPVMTNCAPEEQNTVSKSGKRVPGVIQAYRDLAGGVDTANQLALRWRERGRFRKWSDSVQVHAVLRSNKCISCSAVHKVHPPRLLNVRFSTACIGTHVPKRVSTRPQTVKKPKKETMCCLLGAHLLALPDV